LNADTVPFPEVTPDQADSFSRRHGLHGAWIRIASRGIVHSVYRVGNAVVKIPRDHPEWTCDTLTEAVAVPAVVRSGFPTPELLAFDDSREHFPVPVLVLGFAEGSPIDPVRDPKPEVRHLGELLCRLHTQVTDVPDPQGWLDEEGDDLFDSTVSQALETVRLSPDERAFLKSVRSVAAPGPKPPTNVFLHNDVHENNLLWTSPSSPTLIDWGDAAWGDPATEFMRIPPEWLVEVVEAYEAGTLTDPGFRKRILRCQVDNSLSNIVRNTRWAEEARGRIKRLSHVCSTFLGEPVPAITA